MAKAIGCKHDEVKKRSCSVDEIHGVTGIVAGNVNKSALYCNAARAIFKNIYISYFLT